MSHIKKCHISGELLERKKLASYEIQDFYRYAVLVFVFSQISKHSIETHGQ